MSDATPTPTTEPALSVLGRIEAELQEAKAEIEAAPAAAETKVSEAVAKVHAEIDTFWENVTRNVIAEVPTRIHNFINAEKDALKARISSLL